MCFFSKADAAEGDVVCSWPGSLVCVETLSLALLCGYSFSISKAIKGPKESTPLGFWGFFVWDFFFNIFFFFHTVLYEKGREKA